MAERLRAFTRTLPTLLTAFILAVAVWIMAVTSSDPSETRAYPNPVPVEVIGQASDLVITTKLPENVAIYIKAPTSVWSTLIAEKAPVRAIIDLSGMEAGDHTIPVQIQVGIKPVEVTSYNPRSVTLTLEPLQTQEFDVAVTSRGALPIGYQSAEPKLDVTRVLVSGAKSWVEQVAEVQAVVDLSQVTTNINQSIDLQAVDADGVIVRDVTITPDKVTLVQEIAQRGGYRNVIVKVVTIGQIASGFRLTSVSVFPPTVTVFSTDPSLVDALPGYIETQPIDLSGKQEGFEESAELRLPSGIQVIGDQNVKVTVGLSPIESSLSLTDVPVETVGLASNLTAKVVPDKVNLIISGPLPALDSLLIKDVRLIVDLTGYFPGVYTNEPKVSLNFPNLKIESISPASFEITVTTK